MDITLFETVLRELAPTFENIVTGLASSLFAYFFIRGEARNKQFEKLKAGKIVGVANELLDNGDISHMEYVKCKNFLSIAKLADRIHREKNSEKKNNRIESPCFDLDWFIRFFEAAGNISNEDIQLLWARILQGEITTPGSFSLRTIETLYRMTKSEANAYALLSQRVIHTLNGLWFIIADGASTIDLDQIDDLIIPNQQIRLLQECGIVNPIGDDLILMFATEPIHNPIKKDEHFALLSAKTILLFDSSLSGKYTKPQSRIQREKSLFFHYYPLTEAGRQLLPVVMEDNEYDLIIQLGEALRCREKQNTKRRIRAYSITAESDEYVYFDSEHDLLMAQ